MANSTADGSVVLAVDMNISDAEKKLTRLTKDIEKAEKNISDVTKERDEAQAKKDDFADRLEQERAKLKELTDQMTELKTALKDTSLSKGVRQELKLEQPALQQKISEQRAEVNALQSEWKKAASSVERYDKKIEDATQKLDDQKTAAGLLTKEIEAARKAQSGMSGAISDASTYLDRFTDRIKKLASRAFVFTIIASALRSMRSWLVKTIKTNDEARQSIAQLKGALLTLAQPLVEVIIPAFVTLVNVLTSIITAVAQLVSLLFGKTLKQSKDGAKALYNEANAISEVGAAAKEAAGSLAGFDEINTITTENAGGGGGGASASDIVPDFESWGLDTGFLDRLKEIADLVGLIAAGLALWKLSDMLPGVLGTIAEKLAGILLTVGGLLLLWKGLTDAWENGVDWLNLIEMIGGLAAAALGLYLLLGPIAAGIMLVVGGLALLVTGFHDAMKNGWNLQNALLSIAGILATGLGISLITGSWIPLLIAGISAVLLALTVATGHGEELIEGIQEILDGFLDFFTGIFRGDIEKAVGGIEKIFEGLKKFVFAVIDGLKDTLLSFLNWMDEKTNGRFHGIIETAKGFVETFFSDLKATAQNVIDALKQIFTGLTQFLAGVFTANWNMAWEGVKNIFKGAWNGIVSLLEGAVNLIVKGLNWLISQINKIKFDVPDWVPEIGGKSLGFSIPTIPEAKIPRLAQGAVIPPNREFMAVLGDQRSGTNIEAPLETIKQALSDVIASQGNFGGDIHITVELDGKVVARNTVKHINDMTRQAGKNVLLV